MGGGTAGLAMAHRLSENGNLTVAVVEAGGFYEQENGNLTVVPGYYLPNLQGTNINWGFTTSPQSQLNHSIFSYPRGKALAGSSALNAMIYQIGTKGSYDAWAEEVGDNSWNFENFLPYFQKSAKYTPPENHLRAANASIPAPISHAYGHGGGPLHVSHPNTVAPLSSWGQLAFREIGISDIPDFASGSLLGSQYCSLTLRPEDETRSSSEASYFQAAFGRNQLQPNLKVYINTLAKQIMFDGNKTATGVLVKSGSGTGSTYLLSANKEVIVSAGAFQSPQLLMVSGIGPVQELRNHNISIVAELPGVGQNMWDHVLWSMVREVNLPTTAIFNIPSVEIDLAKEYLQNQTGLFTTNNADYLGWEKHPQPYFNDFSANTQEQLNTFPSDWPDLEHVIGNFNPLPALSSIKNYAFVASALIKPLSRGNITLASGDMEDMPIINVGWLNNPSDLEQAVVGIKRGRDFWATKAIQGALIGDEIAPGPNVTTDAQLREWAIKHVQTVYQASCTCRFLSDCVVDLCLLYL